MELLFVNVSLLDFEVLLYSGPCNDSQHCGRRIVDWNVRAWCPPSSQTWYLSLFLHKCTFGLNFSPHEILQQNSVNNRFSDKAALIAINFAYMATFSTSHTCHMWRISDFSTSVMWRHLKFLHMWRHFQFPNNCHIRKAEVSPHDNLSPLILLVISVTNMRSDARP